MWINILQQNPAKFYQYTGDLDIAKGVHRYDNLHVEILMNHVILQPIEYLSHDMATNRVWEK